MISRVFWHLGKFSLPVLLFAFAVILNVGCKPKQMATSADRATANMQNTKKGLKDYYKKYFKIGVAVNMASLKGADSALVVKEFNSVTPENDMKMGPIHPKENEYNFK